MKRATWISSILAGLVLGTVAGLAFTFKSWIGLFAFVLLFFLTVYKWVFWAELFASMKIERKRRGLLWFEPMSEMSDLRLYAPVFGRMVIFFIIFATVSSAFTIPTIFSNRAVETAPSSATGL